MAASLDTQKEILDPVRDIQRRLDKFGRYGGKNLNDAMRLIEDIDLNDANQENVFTKLVHEINQVAKDVEKYDTRYNEHIAEL